MSKQKTYSPLLFPNRLIMLMDENGLNATNLAGRLGLDRKTIYSWYNGKSSPNAGQIYRLCNILHTDADYLIGLSNQRKRKAAYINDDFEQAYTEMVIVDYCRLYFNPRRKRDD